MEERGLVRLFARLILGLQFLMAGWYKCFQLTPLGHARELFVQPYADTWIPSFLLWLTGSLIPVLELAAGICLLLGLWVRPALLAIGCILVVVTYGHLLKEPFFSITGHIFPRLILMSLIFLLPAREDRLSLDDRLRGGS